MLGFLNESAFDSRLDVAKAIRVRFLGREDSGKGDHQVKLNIGNSP